MRQHQLGRRVRRMRGAQIAILPLALGCVVGLTVWNGAVLWMLAWGAGLALSGSV